MKLVDVWTKGGSKNKGEKEKGIENTIIKVFNV